jgi:DNA polymerase-3 subunit gamma/tau
MGQALYRKHRPKKLSEVVGQEHITKTLGQALKQGRISHAYLFTGPRGVGKTSIARILAHEINDLPYDDDSADIDIIEIDAASNRRIDEIRELREKVYVAPTSANYKVYIIDEVHMLTREAFNALLKTLEEPPAHVVFILATTDAHKLPETIISRTQRFTFKPVAKDAVVKHLAEIAQDEKIKASPEALELLAEHGEGSFRDSISLLDQASSHGKGVKADEVRRLLGIPPAEAIAKLQERLVAASAQAEIMANLGSLYDEGYQAAAIARQLSQSLRTQLIEGKPALSEERTLDLLRALIEVPASRDPERLLEIILLENMTARNPAQPPTVVAPDMPANTPKASANVAAPPVTAKAASRSSSPHPKEPEEKEAVIPEPDKEASTTEPAPKKSAATGQLFDASDWPAVLAALKQKHNTLYGVVRMAQPTFRDDGTIELAFAFAFHQKRISEAGNKQKLIDTIKDTTGRPVMIECTHDKSVVAQPPRPVAAAETGALPPQPGTGEDLAAISNIFGGGELLES